MHIFIFSFCIWVHCSWIMISVNCEQNIYFLNQTQKLQKSGRNILLKNNTVVDNKCVYTKLDEILGEKFNATKQICCKTSGDSRSRSRIHLLQLLHSSAIELPSKPAIKLPMEPPSKGSTGTIPPAVVRAKVIPKGARTFPILFNFSFAVRFFSLAISVIFLTARM